MRLYASVYGIMAISDVCFMVYAFIDGTGYIFGPNLELIGTIFCKIVYSIPIYFDDLSTHLLTLIAIDRMITIVYPRRFLIMKKRWFQSFIVAIVALIVLSRHIMIPLYINIVEANQTNSSQTIRDCFVSDEILNIDIWITIVDFVVVNILVNNWLNIKTIRFIMESRRRVNGNATLNSLSSRDRKFAICSILLNLVCMVCKLPLFICLVIIGYLNLTYEESNVIIKITGDISLIHNGFSFFINMYVNSLFYDEFLRLFRMSPSNGIR